MGLNWVPRGKLRQAVHRALPLRGESIRSHVGVLSTKANLQQPH